MKLLKKLSLSKKVFLSILGGCNMVMNLFTPIAIAFLLINVPGMIVSKGSATLIIVIAIASTLFRGIKPWVKK